MNKVCLVGFKLGGVLFSSVAPCPTQPELQGKFYFAKNRPNRSDIVVDWAYI